MNSLFSPRWWVDMFIHVFVVMIFIYFIKRIAEKYQIPVVQKVAEGI